MARLDSLMRQNFIEYASYSILDRAIPDLRDGLKPVQRRILHTLFTMHDGRFHKVANVIGETMKLHPHGDASIGDALVVLANKEYFIERQGNFGSQLTGHPAAAARYIECRLTPLALDTMFDPNLTTFVESYDGRSKEPVALPSKLPVALLLGIEGIAVGMSTRILPHNLPELWEAQIDLLKGEPIELHPDFPQGGIADVSEYDDGRGKVEVRAAIKARDERHVVITELPYGTTTETLIASIEAAAQKGRVKIASIDDFTTDRVEIQLTLPRGVQASEVIPQLYAYTDCRVSLTSNIVVIRDRRPVQLGITEILKELTEGLREQLRAELEWEQREQTDKKHWLTLEQIFVEKRVYKRIEEATTDKAVRAEVMQGMKPYAELMVREMTEDDVKRLLDVRIRRISAYDIEKNRRDIGEIEERLARIAEDLTHLTRTTIRYVEGLLEKYGDAFPRRTHTKDLETIDRKAVARANIRLGYDRDTGFFGSQVKGEHRELTVSEFDLVLAIAEDGSFRVMPPVEKVLFTGRLLYCELFDPEQGFGFTMVYRDRAKIAFAKRVHVQKFIRNKEYELIKGKAGKIDLLLPAADGPPGTVSLKFAAAPRQRVKAAKFDLGTLEPTGVAARGTRLAPKPVSRVQLLAPRKPRARPKPGPGPKPGQHSLF
ncbi:MAG: DNA topoisomerase IV subunit A [Myxococcota bacterium]|nr:DNA topoisomerase IV subunit A [Myxococcota bacterium]